MQTARTAATATTIALALLLAGAVSAQATVSVQTSGTTLAIFGSAGDDAPQVDYYAPASPGSAGYTRIFDPDGVVDPLPAGCDRNDPEGQAPEDIAMCPDGGSAVSLTRLEMTLDDGFDEPHVEEICFEEFLIDLGEGERNEVTMPPCSSGVFGVIGGGGEDALGINYGGPAVGLTVVADLGGGDDTFDGGEGPSEIHAGPGKDYLVGNGGDDVLFGEDGDDRFLGHGGDDRYDGGPGNDEIGISPGINNDEDPGNDDYRGGDGSDVLALDNHPAGMTISIDEAANDGSNGEADNVHGDIEVIRGTDHNDDFTGGPGADNFDGGTGNDTIHGGDGDDDLYGGGGDDKVFGDAGTDKVQGGPEADTVDGGAGADQIYGDIAGCSVFCNFDPDLLFARDGERDTVDCGGGADTAQVDTADVVAFCAVVDTQSAGGGAGGGGGGGGGGTPGVTAAFTFVTGAVLSVKRGARTTVTCPAACRFVVSVVLSAKTARRYGLGRRKLVVGTARGALLAAGEKKVTVKLSKKAKRKLRRARRVAATLRVRVTDAAGAGTTKSRPIVLRR